MPLTSVLLDLDGTLVDTNPAHAESYLRAFSEFGYAVDQPSIDRQVGKGGDKLVPALIGEEADRQHGEDIRERAAETFIHLLAPARRFRLFRGAEALIDELRARGLKTAIATSSDAGLRDAIFGSVGVDLRRRVDAVTTKTDVDLSKPAGDVLRAALDRLEAQPEEALLIGDTIYDFESAARAGVGAVGVTTWVWDAEALRAAGATMTFPDPEAILAHLDEVHALSPAPATES